MDIWQIGHNQSAPLLASLRDPRRHPQPVEVICFDYFDTLVVRRVIPEHTKMLAAAQLCCLVQADCTAEALYASRRDLEKQVCDANIAAGRAPDFNLVYFAEMFFDSLPDSFRIAVQGWSKRQFATTMLQIETAVEKQVQEVCREAVDLAIKLREQGYRLALVSDFYLPGSCFREMLDAHGLNDLFPALFISADHDLTKGSGQLYARLCAKMRCRPEQVVMIGDNPHADVAMARKAGMRAVQVVNSQQQQVYHRLMQTASSPIAFQALEALPRKSTTTPFLEMGLSLWLFIHRLFARLKKEGINDVFFFSKEGQFLKRLFDRYQDDLFGHRRICSHYLLVSRKATFLASLRPLQEEDFSRLFNHYRDISLRDFLLSLNMEETVASNLCASLSLDFATRVSDLRSSREFAALTSDQFFAEQYESRRRQQRQNFIQYLDSFGVDYVNKGLALVDVGWKGSIQDNVYHILERKVACNGFFIGSLIATERHGTNRKTGLLFSDFPEPSAFFDVYNNNRSLYEMLLGATHGSADGYLTGQQVADGADLRGRTVSVRVAGTEDEIQVLTMDLPEERILYNQTIQPLQDEMFKLFCQCNHEFILSRCAEPDEVWFARQHARMVFTPTGKEVKLFLALYHLENFGIFEYTRFQSSSLPSVAERFKHLKNILSDRALLESGIWPPVILNHLGLGLYRHVDGLVRMRKAFH